MSNATVEAIVIDEFGPVRNLRRAEIELPSVLEPGQLRVRLAAAGVGSWDPFEREGGYAELIGVQPDFPYVLGSEGAGTVIGVAGDVDDVAVGDAVFCVGFLDPVTTFYAVGTVARAELTARIPDHLDVVRAAGLAGAGTTSLRGLVDVLAVGAGDRVAVTGASGALGHVAVQIAVALGAEVTAIASGGDGVDLVRRLGAHHAFDGRAPGAIEQLGEIDKALLLAPGTVSEYLAHSARAAAFPTGVPLDPDIAQMFNGELDADIVDRLAALVRAHHIDVHVHATYQPDEITNAHRALGEHHLGKLVLDTSKLNVTEPLTRA